MVWKLAVKSFTCLWNDQVCHLTPLFKDDHVYRVNIKCQCFMHQISELVYNFQPWRLSQLDATASPLFGIVHPLFSFFLFLFHVGFNQVNEVWKPKITGMQRTHPDSWCGNMNTIHKPNSCWSIKAWILPPYGAHLQHQMGSNYCLL